MAIEGASKGKAVGGGMKVEIDKVETMPFGGGPGVPQGNSLLDTVIFKLVNDIVDLQERVRMLEQRGPQFMPLTAPVIDGDGSGTPLPWQPQITWSSTGKAETMQDLEAALKSKESKAGDVIYTDKMPDAGELKDVVNASDKGEIHITDHVTYPVVEGVREGSTNDNVHKQPVG